MPGRDFLLIEGGGGRKKLDILHIIGKVGAGKSHFIRSYLTRFGPEVFDIKDVYEEGGFTPEDVHNAQAYGQFAGAISYKLGGFLEHMKGQEGLFVIESSGLNRAINEVVEKVSHYTLLIESHYPATIERKRPYARELNDLFEQKMIRKEIAYHNIFYAEEKVFAKPLDPTYAPYFARIGATIGTHPAGN